MITRRQIAIALGAGPLAAPVPVAAQTQPAPGLRRIGFLGLRSRSTALNPDPLVDAFVQGMRELGYIEGKNLVIEWRFADYNFDRLAGLATELIQTKPELIVTHYSVAAQMLQAQTKTIPIVITASNDPVASGFAASLARPGGNVTGLSLLTVDLSGKQIELLRIMVPGLSRVAVLVNPVNTSHAAIVKQIQIAAQPVGIEVVTVEANNAEAIERGIALMRRDRAGAFIVATDAVFSGQIKLIGATSMKERMPSMFSFSEFVKAGGLMSYGLNVAENWRRAATFVDKIFKGAKPGDLPFEQPMRIFLVVNRGAAKALGLTIPRELLLKADEVIE